MKISDTQFRFKSRTLHFTAATAPSDMDAEISSLEKRRTKTKALKQGTMQELLTGKKMLV